MFNAITPIQMGNDWFVEKPLLEKTTDWQLIALAIYGALALGAILYAWSSVRRTGRQDALWICLGAALAAFYEPLGDLCAHVAYHEINQINFTTAFGFSVPLWVLPSYVAFFGLPVVALLAMLERGVTSKQWMIFYFGALPGALLFEAPLLAMGAIEYYGANQPFQIYGYPVWMGFVNGCTMFVVTTAMYFITRTNLIKARPYLLTPLMPLFVLGANGGAALPLASAINSSSSSDVVNVFACVSMALATLYVWICGQLVAGKAR